MIPSVKGNQIKFDKAYLNKMFGPDALDKVLAEMDRRDKDIISGVVLDSTWIPEETAINFYVAVDRVFGKGDYQLCYDLGYYEAKEGISKFYKIFIRFGKPSFVIQNAPALWKQLHNTGRFEVIANGPNSANGKLIGFATPHKSYCKNMLGYIKGVLELSGAKNVSAREIKCATEGADCCEYITAWE